MEIWHANETVFMNYLLTSRSIGSLRFRQVLMETSPWVLSTMFPPSGMPENIWVAKRRTLRSRIRPLKMDGNWIFIVSLKTWNRSKPRSVHFGTNFGSQNHPFSFGPKDCGQWGTTFPIMTFGVNELPNAFQIEIPGSHQPSERNLTFSCLQDTIWIWIFRAWNMKSTIPISFKDVSSLLVPLVFLFVDSLV